MKKLLIFILSIFQLKCDLPVHCVAKDIEGVWIFFLNKNLEDSQQRCGHHIPDQNTDNKIRRNFKLLMPDKVIDLDSNQTGIWTMVYDEGFQIKIAGEVFFAFSKYKLKEKIIPKDDDDEQTKGYESLCDETFMGWFYNENNLKWGCYSGKKTEKIQEKINYLESIQGNHLKIVENQFLNQQNQQTKTQLIDQISTDIKQKSDVNIFIQKNELEITKQNFLSPQLSKSNQQQGFYNRFKQNLPLYNIPHSNYLFNNNKKQSNKQNQFLHDYSFIELVNNEENKSPWVATAHDHFSNQTNEYMQKIIGLGNFAQEKLNIVNNINQTTNIQDQKLNNQENNKSQQNNNYFSFLQIESQIHSNEQFFLQKDKKLKQVYDYETNSLQVETNTDEIQQDNTICGKSDNNIPRCFDWRNVNGVNYESEVKKQGDCGSCYAVSVLSAFEARIRIKSKSQYSPNLSISGSISCSAYNQGCNGGYPFLVAKNGHEIGFYEEFCQPYVDQTQQCRQQCFKQSKVWKISDYGYVGKNYYGSTNEESMLKEIYENGPVVVAINASPDLYYYSSGVFITNPQNRISRNIYKIGQSNGRKDIHPWEFTNHAVSCVGWGETEHQGEILKYWILKNSWGKDWGDQGYFKMLRGQNLAAVENQAIYFNPKLD